jgi:hypothetical protein
VHAGNSPEIIEYRFNPLLRYLEHETNAEPLVVRDTDIHFSTLFITQPDNS